MYVGKRIKSILSVLLICGLLVVSVPSRAFAAGPLVLGPALKYAIGAGMVAGGLYAANKDDLNYAINDYWTKASDHVKQQWSNAVIYGTGIGIILLNDPLNRSISNYLNSEYVPGQNSVVADTEVITDIVLGKAYPTDNCVINDYNIRGYCSVLGPSTLRFVIYVNGEIWADHTYTNTQYWYKLSHVISTRCIIENLSTYNGSITFVYKIARTDGTTYTTSSSLGLLGLLNGASISYAAVLNHIYMEYVGDTAGFGKATEGRPDIKVPCPPVPAAEWPDNWIDDLQEEMNRTGNPTLDDETSIEEWEDEYEWYLDEFGNIYKVKKGQQPKKPEDEPLRIPGPPFPAPDVPKNYPTEDEPDLTVEHHPPQTTVTENPDGSRTETTTQTTTTTKKWWDPSSQRWRTTTTDTTTTTTVDFAPDGTETGRTTTTTTQPKGEREETAQPDDTAIDWEPLRRGLYELTEKFPFCLPWDLMRGIQSLESSQWDRKIRIEVGDGIWPAMVIDLTMFDGIASITRVILLIVFDLGLIFGTRKLMGGDV